jgi:hypothetical protein
MDLHDAKKSRRWTALTALSLLGWMLLPAWPNATLGQSPGQAVPREQQALTPAAVLPDSQEGFYDIEQLERLFQIARESGFTEDDVREITIEDEEGNIVNAWDYLQEIKRRRAMQDQADQEKLHRLYITVQDILADLRKRERADLRKLRESTVFPE